LLASGGGTNVQTVIDAVAAGTLALDLRAIIANRVDAFALERARQAGIERAVLVWQRRAISRERYDEHLLELVAKYEPELVLLLGWMHVLPARFIERFGAIVNIHPAYLPLDPKDERVIVPDGTAIPAFRGARAIADALAARSPWYGATVHRVGVDVDRGEVLERRAIRLEAQTEEEALAALRPVEQEVLTTALTRWLEQA
jgi:phosphoribosylglycinamide formyltransferase-1